MKIVFLAVLITFFNQLPAQGILRYTPQHPEAGDEIRFSYTLPPDHVSTPEAFAVKYEGRREHLSQVPLTKTKNTYTGIVKTDTAVNLLVLSFNLDGNWDNNSNNGFLIPLYENQKVKRHAHINAAHFFNFYGSRRLGLEKNEDVALHYLEKEFALYPDSRYPKFSFFLSLLYKTDSSRAKRLALEEADAMIKKGLHTKEDYQRIQYIYTSVGMPQKAASFKKQRRDKIPYDPYDIEDLREILRQEKDIAVKEKLLARFEAEEKKDTSRIFDKELMNALRMHLIGEHLKNKNWNRFKDLAGKISGYKYFLYNDAASRAMEDSATWVLAAAFEAKAVAAVKKEWQLPSGTIPNDMTYEDYVAFQKDHFGSASDKCARILYQLKRYDEALPYSREAAFITAGGGNIVYNRNYALIVSNVLSPQLYKPQLEKFVKEGKADSTIIAILKKAYALSGSSTVQSDSYIAKLKNEADLLLTNGLKQQLLNTPSFPFALMNSRKESVRLDAYKGKVVVLDFWATWCRSCIASLPAMNELVEQYKGDPSVVFLFINTLEHGNDKANTFTSFVKEKGYEFNWLFDADNKVADSYDVTGLPTKIIIGRDGNVKFRSIGFGGDEILKKHLPVMIRLAN